MRRRCGGTPHSRIDPADDHQPLDNTTPAKRISTLPAIRLVRQRRQGSRTNEEQDERNGERHQVREDAKGAVVAEQMEANDQGDCGVSAGAYRITTSSPVSEPTRPPAPSISSLVSLARPPAHPHDTLAQPADRPHWLRSFGACSDSLVIAVVHTLATNNILILASYAPVCTGGYPSLL